MTTERTDLRVRKGISTAARPRLLDLFCGAGGAAMGYHLAGFEVFGVDIAPQPNYPFEYMQHEAVDFLEKGWGYEFDAIHASPPCQRWTAYGRRPNHVKESPDLVGSTRAALEHVGRPYVIENIYRAPLSAPVRLCGSSFDLDVRRHRFFESSLPLMAPPCNHGWQTPRFPQATNRKNLRCTVEIGVWRIPLSQQQKAMGIDWMTLEELSQAIPPAYTGSVGEQLIEQLEAVA